MASDPDAYNIVEATEEYKELDKTCPSFINDITKKVAKRAVARHRSPSSSSGGNSDKETTSVSRYNPSAVIIGTHELRIEHFSAIRKIHGVGDGVHSNFQLGGYEWTMTVYPSGGRQEFKEHIGLYLKPTINHDNKVQASVTMKLVDPSGKPSPPVLYYNFTHIYAGKKCDGYGWGGFTTVAYANSHYVGHDGSLTAHCRVEVVTESCTSNTLLPAMTNPVTVPPSNMSWHLEQLLASEEGWDIKFLVEESEIHAHGLVIAARSPALHELVESAIGTDHVGVDGMKSSTFKAMLHFIYTDELPHHIDDLAVIRFDDVLMMLGAACRFRLERMRKLCENLLAENINAGNLLAYISLPHVIQDVMKTLSTFCRISL